MCVFFLVPFSCAFFVVHEEAMHMTSTPGFGVNCFFPFIFSLVFLTLGLFVIPRKFQVFFCYYLLDTHTQRQKQTQTNTNTNKHKQTHTHAHTRTHTHTHAHAHMHTCACLHHILSKMYFLTKAARCRDVGTATDEGE